MKRNYADISGIPETRWNGTGSFWSYDYQVIFSEQYNWKTEVCVTLNKKRGNTMRYIQTSGGIILGEISKSENKKLFINEEEIADR